MKISCEQHGDIALVIASGDFAHDGEDQYRRTVGDRFAQGSRSVILDLANVANADSTALECLLWTAEEATARGGSLRLVAPQDNVREALRLTRLTERFEYAESVELAARSMR
ncbi:MAG: STAS domain-containing protein [Phycisphaerales bacterium]